MDYKGIITLTKNNRGIYDLDTTKGCKSGTKNNKNGCYNECYAAKCAKRYGYNFTETTIRKFIDIDHVIRIRNQIELIDMPFIRIGVNSDPSENWEHTINVISLIYGIKDIVIITKHWKSLTDSQLKKLAKYGVCINTSISALDSNDLITYRLSQYKRLSNNLRSILRVVTCDFNKNNLTGLNYDIIQDNLLKNENVIDTVFRISNNNELYKLGIIKAEKSMFMSNKVLLSKHSDRIFTGHCINCPDMCGLN